jgi:uncharacterized protein YfcZ (UPF0381/DUF406 family)
MSASRPQTELVKEVWSACNAIAAARAKDNGDASAEWVRFDDALNRLKEQLEAFQELAQDADAITSIGHGLELDVPVNLGSFKWAESAFHILETMASLASYPAKRPVDVPR